jgi:hypothetical protein
MQAIPAALRSVARALARLPPGTQFTSITSTKVQILTSEQLRALARRLVRSLLVLLVQKYQY